METDKKKVVLAYSGGLDTSVAIKWIQEKYNMDVIALTIDLGTEKDLMQRRYLFTISFSLHFRPEPFTRMHILLQPHSADH